MYYIVISDKEKSELLLLRLQQWMEQELQKEVLTADIFTTVLRAYRERGQGYYCPQRTDGDFCIGP